MYDSFLFIGHGTSEKTGKFDPGAVYNGEREYDIVNQIVTKAKYILSMNQKTKHLKIHYDENNFSDNDTLGNEYKTKSGLSVHINAGKGRGVEVFAPINERYIPTDLAVCDDISKELGIPNRGVKSRDYNTGRFINRKNGVVIGGKDYYGEIRRAWENGLSLSILEVGFIDSSDLPKIKDKINELAFIVAKYIATLNKIDIKEDDIAASPVVNSDVKPYYRVCVGTFKERENAENFLGDVKANYKDAFIHIG